MQKIKAIVVLATLLAISFATLGMRTPEAKAEAPKVYEAWIQPGTYTGFTFCSNANVNTRRWLVSLVCRDRTYPLIITPGETTILPFDMGWTVTADDEARFVSKNIPFSDLSEWDALAGDNQPMLIGAWGMTTKGPMQLVPSKIKK